MLALPPLADLHRHLDGSLRPSTLRELAAAARVSLPEDIRFFPGMGLAQALARFRVTLSLLQDTAAVRRVAAEICEDATAEGVTTLEIRFAPQLHGGAPLEAMIDAAAEGVDGRAGIILCGLYGDPPEVLWRLVEAAHSRPAVVGLDLAGGPMPGHAWALDDYAPAFARARDLGLGRTVHAGEGRAPEEIRMAVERLHAERVGHGTTLLADGAVLDLILDRGITIEACITSNLHTGAIREVQAHPLPEWLRRGVQACICTDNTLFSDIDAPREHAKAAGLPGMDEAKLLRAIACGHAAAFRRR
jgi:adenosine deaminase